MEYLKTRKSDRSNSLAPKFNRSRQVGILFLPVAICTFSQGCGLGQAKFSTPEEATEALIHSLRSDDSKQLQRILGRSGRDVVSSGDEVADRHGREVFLAAYEERHELVLEPDGSTTLQVGADDWPMPIPLVKGLTSWRFDTRRGREEMLNRRIGRNERSVEQTCLAVVDAQREYFAADPDGDGVREYAQRIVSDPNKKDGLYWESGPGEPPSPLGPLVAEAVAEGYASTRNDSGQRRPFHGYYFKLLRAQGPNAPGGAKEYVVNEHMTEGFAVVAWPAEYGNSGVMTFMVNQDGVVFQNNLGRRTDQIAEAITEFDPDESWTLSVE